MKGETGSIGSRTAKCRVTPCFQSAPASARRPSDTSGFRRPSWNVPDSIVSAGGRTGVHCPVRVVFVRREPPTFCFDDGSIGPRGQRKRPGGSLRGPIFGPNQRHRHRSLSCRIFPSTTLKRLLDTSVGIRRRKRFPGKVNASALSKLSHDKNY